VGGGEREGGRRQGSRGKGEEVPGRGYPSDLSPVTYLLQLDPTS
jgi:hypothetical protein